MGLTWRVFVDQVDVGKATGRCEEQQVEITRLTRLVDDQSGHLDDLRSHSHHSHQSQRQHDKQVERLKRETSDLARQLQEAKNQAQGWSNFRRNFFWCELERSVMLYTR